MRIYAYGNHGKEDSNTPMRVRSYNDIYLMLRAIYVHDNPSRDLAQVISCPYLRDVGGDVFDDLFAVVKWRDADVARDRTVRRNLIQWTLGRGYLRTWFTSEGSPLWLLISNVIIYVFKYSAKKTQQYHRDEGGVLWIKQIRNVTAAKLCRYHVRSLQWYILI